MLCTHKTTIFCQFGNLEICPNFANPYLTQFSSIFGGNCITNGEVFLFLHLVEVGGHPNTAPHPPPAVPAPPASILYVSNSVAPDMDELTHNVSEWGGVFVPTSRRSQHSHGGSRMEWTWRTATESNMPNSPKSSSSVQEVFHEVSGPNPMGNAVTSEETHGNAVAGAAAASAVAQPPVD